MRRAALAILPLLLMLAAPAGASTIPDMALREHQLAVSVGLLDLDVDWAVLDRLQVGAGGFWSLVGTAGYGRLSYRLWDKSPIGDIGLNIAGGIYSGVLVKGPNGLFAFAGPVVAWPLGDRVMVRASLGLFATNSHSVVYDPTARNIEIAPVVSRAWGLGLDDAGSFMVLPNLEVGIKLAGNQELTLGGNSLVGWRNRF